MLPFVVNKDVIIISRVEVERLVQGALVNLSVSDEWC